MNKTPAEEQDIMELSRKISEDKTVIYTPTVKKEIKKLSFWHKIMAFFRSQEVRGSSGITH